MGTHKLEPRCFLSIDIGTSSLKTALVDWDGNKRAEYQSFSTILQPAPGLVEQNAEQDWWQAACRGIRHCLRHSGIAPAAIAGVCASGMVPNLCPLDAKGEVVRPAILYRDNRAIQEVRRLKQDFGLTFTLQDVLPKLLWLKNNEPDSFARIHTVLNTHSYLVYKLTGQLSSDTDSAGLFGHVYQSHERRWSTGLMGELGLDNLVLPPLYDPLDIVGGVNSAASEVTGLAPGTPVLAGTGDSYTVLVGAGVVEAGEGLIYLGTAGTFLGLRTSLGPLLRTRSPFLEGDVQFVGNSLMGGEIARWFKDSFLQETNLSLEDMSNAAAAIPPGAQGLFALPHLLGERTPKKNPLAKGVLFGLTNAHTRHHAYRAFLEGVAYVLRDSYEAAGLPLSRISICGGGAHSTLWRQIIASVLGRPLQYTPAADSVLGTAYLAGLGLGVFHDFSVMREQWLQKGEKVRPDNGMAAIYEERFVFYKQLNAMLEPAYRLLAELGH